MPITGTLDANADPVNYKDCYVEIDLGADGSWEPLWSWAAEVAISGETVPTTETYPFGHDAIVFTGRPEPVEVVVTAVYTESSVQPFYNIRSYFESDPGGPANVRFLPKGSAAGNLKFETSGGKLRNALPPPGAGDANSPTLFSFTVRGRLDMGVHS